MDTTLEHLWEFLPLLHGWPSQHGSPALVTPAVPCLRVSARSPAGISPEHLICSGTGSSFQHVEALWGAGSS